MNDIDLPIALEAPVRPILPTPDHHVPGPTPPRKERRSRGWMLGLAVLALFLGALGFGVWRHYQQYIDVTTSAAQRATYVPCVRIEQVTQRLGTVHVSLL